MHTIIIKVDEVVQLYIPDSNNYNDVLILACLIKMENGKTPTNSIIIDDMSILQLFLPTIDNYNSLLILACLLNMETKHTVCIKNIIYNLLMAFNFFLYSYQTFC